MPKPNLGSLSIDALLKLRDEVEKALSHRVKELQDQLSRLGHAPGLRGGRSLLKGRKVAVKYRDKSGNTWAGRGAQPVWLREKLKAGPRHGSTASLVGAGLKDHRCDLLGAVDADPGAEHPAARAVATRLVRCQSEALTHHASTLAAAPRGQPEI
jgi:hypothetical protein